MCGAFLCLIDTLLVCADWRSLGCSTLRPGLLWWCVCIVLVKQSCEHCRNTRDTRISFPSAVLLISSLVVVSLSLPALWHGPLCSDMVPSCWIIILRCYCRSSALWGLYYITCAVDFMNAWAKPAGEHILQTLLSLQSAGASGIWWNQKQH